MAELQQGAINFPWQMFMDAQAMRNQNRNDMYKNIEGMGSGAGMIGKDVEQYKARQALMLALAQMRAGPQQGPQLPGAGMAPGQQTPTSGMGAPSTPPDWGTAAVNYGMAFPGKENPLMGAFANQFDPLKQAEIAHYKAEVAAIPQRSAETARHNQMDEFIAESTRRATLAESERAAKERAFNEITNQQKDVNMKRASLTAGQSYFHNWIPGETPTEKALRELHGPMDTAPAPAFGSNRSPASKATRRLLGLKN